MSKGIQSVKGMNDLLPDDAGVWQFVEDTIRTTADAYGYREIRTPIPERTDLFKRGIGEATDIVEKEMFTWEDRGGDSLTLRPEMTASCVRAGIQHGLFHNQTQRIWYMGPMFRRERPQRGRYRQFHQFGIEAFGWTGAEIDAEVIVFGARLWKALGINDIRLELNSLGSDETRSQYRETLVGYLTQHMDILDEDSRRRLETNPLRVLDSKNPAMREMIEAAPSIVDSLDVEARAHFDSLAGYLGAVGIEFAVSPRLVRGLDYYTSTVFEWTTDQLGAQSAVCGGGRYDGLVESLGGRSTPGCGFALGMERLIELVRLSNPELRAASPQVFVVNIGDAARQRAFSLAEQLREAGISVVFAAGSGSIKSQMKQADKSGALFAVILGEDEVANDTIALKPLTTGEEQQTVPQEELQTLLQKRLQ